MERETDKKMQYPQPGARSSTFIWLLTGYHLGKCFPRIVLCIRIAFSSRRFKYTVQTKVDRIQYQS